MTEPITEVRNQKRELRPTLVFLNGDSMSMSVPLEREEVIMGRALGADVRLNDFKVSRQHASITTIYEAEKGETKYLLTDLDSKNGTFINGEKIDREWLHNGDKIGVGELLLRFEQLDEIDREYHRQIRRLVTHDDLTGLHSSRSFFSELRRETARSAAEKRPFCVLMLDVDHFKNVNDTYGHLTGSHTLEELGGCITKNLRTGDVAARFGGEEFAAFLLDAELIQGLVAAERIRQSIEEAQFSVVRQGKKTDTHQVTISIGVSSFPTDSKDPIELVEMADSALYRAKRAGRNRVCAYRDLTDEEVSMPLPARRE
ncbi:MAG TPA: GGDEF domain-containing protein [Pyrinomonadaceae bacterium]|jgi:diguanylate cyclase (GGDEF)-like protein|nr:GGDEF domain-containing protein [Pyrinomonadaceae bacterium]